jgi:pfkB family carbohydrate kinase
MTRTNLSGLFRDTEATTRERCVVLGSGLIALDVVVGADQSTGARIWAGGTCGNVLAILGYFGWSAYAAGNLGDDFAGTRVREDLSRWGVSSEFLTLRPENRTPVIVEKVWKSNAGVARHRFFWKCPSCGASLPGYRALAADNAIAVSNSSMIPRAFFFDRVSKHTLNLARWSARLGAIVVFEPSSIGDERMFAHAVSVSHILKFSHDRVTYRDGIPGPQKPVLEIETLGEDGLRYRLRSTGKKKSIWNDMPAYKISGIQDTAGAGDWCTAGMLHSLRGSRFPERHQIREHEIADALRFGQAIAAINCKYEGARGAMYGLTRKQFKSAVFELVSGQEVSPERASTKDKKLAALFTAICSACGESSERREPRKVDHRSLSALR